MKKLKITVVLAAVLLVSGCSETISTKSQNTSVKNTEGSWKVNQNLKTASLPSDAQKAFEKAVTADTEENVPEPIVLFGRQIVSGTNYSILCKQHDKYTSAGNEDKLEVVTIYEDLNSNASVLSIVPFDLSKIAGTDKTVEDKEDMIGAFEANTEYEAQSFDDEVQEAFKKATRNLSEDLYVPSALLGTQTVSGTNYAILCLSTAACTKKHENCWDVLTIYEDLNGKVSITSINELDLSAYTDYNRDE